MQHDKRRGSRVNYQAMLNYRTNEQMTNENTYIITSERSQVQ